MRKIPVKYKVDEGVPIPVRVESIPLRKLEVGQSIKFPRERRAYVQQQASRLKREGLVFTVKVEDETNCRVWRKA